MVSADQSPYSRKYSVDSKPLYRLGRKLRVAVIGGGTGAQIAETHRLAMRYDDVFEIVAGVLSSNPQRSISEGIKIGIKRAYPNIRAMIDSEAVRSDKPDLIAIMSPNDNHAPSCLAGLKAGYHIICDKPLANTIDEGLKIAKLAKQYDRLVCVTHNYSGYPMVRQMRAMVLDGSIGSVHQVQVRYAQGNLGKNIPIEEMSAALRWRLDPEKGGANNLLLDVGVHAHQLLNYTTELDFVSLTADVGPSFQDRKFDDTAMVIGRLSNGARACLIATKAATGAPQILDIEIYGSDGGLSWRQQDPQSLAHWRQGLPTQHYHRGVTTLDQNAVSAMRNPRPHPEGFREAFANIYFDFAASVAAHIMREVETGVSPNWPDENYAIRSLQFIDACIRSSVNLRPVSIKLDGMGV